MAWKLFEKFRDRNLWLFMGSGLIVSVAYIDPGNWGTNIAGGSTFNYALLWAIWMASGMAMIFQYLSGKLGIAGYSLPEIIRIKFKKRWLLILYWLACEVAILATDLAEFLGIVVALNLLFGIPLLIGSVISVLLILLFFVLVGKNFRTIEIAFMAFVSVIGIGFIYEVFISKPDLNSIVYHSIIPSINPASALIVVGIIGATVMPHALFVHSWLVKNKIANFSVKSRQILLRYHIIDNILSLTIAALINAAMLIMAAAAFYQQGVVATFSGAYQTLIPLFGNLSAVIFGIALLAAGISASITGTIAGQSIMEGLTDFKISPLLRRLITRVINLIPITVAIALGIEPLRILLYSQAFLCILIPLPLIPLIIYTSDKEIMKELVNKKITTIISWILATVIVGFNIYLICSIL